MKDEISSGGAWEYLGAMVIALVVVLINGVLLGAAIKDQSWGAMRIAFMVGPITNAVILGLGLLCSFAGKRWMGDGWILTVTTAVTLPVLAVVVDFLVIMSLRVHGG